MTKPITPYQWGLFLNDFRTYRDIGRAAVRSGFNRNTVYKKMKRDPQFAAAVKMIQQTPPPEPNPAPPGLKNSQLLFLMQIKSVETPPRLRYEIESNPQ
jgi:hypothetical protein